MLCKNSEIVLLTPNIIEFNRIYEKQSNKEGKYINNINKSNIINIENTNKINFNTIEQLDEYTHKISYIADIFNNINILLKGPVDIISNGINTIIINEKSTIKRCGGQGDVLSGMCGTFYSWSIK